METEYLVSTNFSLVPRLNIDCLVIGSGIAGLSAAIEASKHGSVLVLSKTSRSENNTMYAQGGVAACLSAEDTPRSHMQDTIDAGAGLCDEKPVKILVEEGAKVINELIKWGTRFDRDESGDIRFTQEGAHTSRRILHANGDASGREILTCLLGKADSIKNIYFLENHFAIDLLHHKNECYGAYVLDRSSDRDFIIQSRLTVLASGGCGMVYQETTNPSVATGDGIGLGFRSGCILSDMEFVQFHPTTLYLAGAPRFLISEAVRGEGGKLVDVNGKSFMTDYHELGDLAPRDVVSQAITREMIRENQAYVYLDLRDLGSDRIRKRFPNIHAECMKYDLDITSTPIPVRPSEHYIMGGIRTDINAATSVKRLYACGETACAGVHGANRLASNSMLEGLVFGKRAGMTLEKIMKKKYDKFPFRDVRSTTERKSVFMNLTDLLSSMKSLMWKDVGIFRSGEKLSSALNKLNYWAGIGFRSLEHSVPWYEFANMITSALIITKAAARREESRGAHNRVDFPEKDDEHWLRHIDISNSDWKDT